MSKDEPTLQKSIAGVPHTVFSALPPEDRALLKVLENAGITLDSLYQKAQKAQKT